MKTKASLGMLAALVHFGPGAVAGAAVVAAPGFSVRAIPTPDTVQGGVIQAWGAVLVGQGPGFTAGAQRVVRLGADGTPTVIATGFSSLGGFALDGAGTLLVVDNGREAGPAATTGDTLYAIPDALGRTTALAARDAEVLPADAIPSAQDVHVAPDGAALVTDAAGPGAGRIVRVAGGIATTLVTGLDFVGGLAVGVGDTLHVANTDATFAGNVLRFTLAGLPLAPLALGLAGTFDVVVDAVGTVLVSGGFGSPAVVAFTSDGGASERATGFVAPGEMFHDRARDELLVLEFGATEVTAVCRDRDGNAVCDADEAPCGDVTGDGVVDVADALAVAQWSVGLRVCGEPPFALPVVCDVGARPDGACTIADALGMAQCGVGLRACAFACAPFSCP
jgi:hypothetical protein